MIETPLNPKGKTNYKVTEDCVDEEELSVKKDYVSSVDKEASWLKKGGKFHYGYKIHHVTDEENLILAVLNTKASTNEITNLEEIIDSTNLPEEIAVKADKGYPSQKNADILIKKKLKNHILKKSKKNKPLTERQKKFNKRVG